MKFKRTYKIMSIFESPEKSTFKPDFQEDLPKDPENQIEKKPELRGKESIHDDRTKFLEELRIYGAGTYIAITSAQYEVDKKLTELPKTNQIQLETLYRDLRREWKIKITPIKHYEIGEPSKYETRMPTEWEFGKAIKKHLTRIERYKKDAGLRGIIDDEEAYLQSINELENFGNGFADQASKDNNLSVATDMWIITGEYDKNPIIREKIKKALADPKIDMNQKISTKAIIERYQRTNKED